MDFKAGFIVANKERNFKDAWRSTPSKSISMFSAN
jgi:hypothetical protein